jgi:hypothetical protein
MNSQLGKPGGRRVASVGGRSHGKDVPFKDGWIEKLKNVCRKMERGDWRAMMAREQAGRLHHNLRRRS